MRSITKILTGSALLSMLVGCGKDEIRSNDEFNKLNIAATVEEEAEQRAPIIQYLKYAVGKDKDGRRLRDLDGDGNVDLIYWEESSDIEGWVDPNIDPKLYKEHEYWGRIKLHPMSPEIKEAASHVLEAQHLLDRGYNNSIRRTILTGK